MKAGHRFVDCDMHIFEPPDLFEKYLDSGFKHRVTTRRGPGGKLLGGWKLDGRDFQGWGGGDEYFNILTRPIDEVYAAVSAKQERFAFARERGFDPESQVMAMEMEGIDIAVLFPSKGLWFMARDNMDPLLSLAICQAYNNWMFEFCQYSPNRMKWVAMLPVHEVNLACQELVRCVEKLSAVGSFIRPNPVNGYYWNSLYWEPLYRLHEDLDVAWCFHEGYGSTYSQIEPRFQDNLLARHVACHWVEAQLAMIAQIAGGIFERYPKLRVAYLEAQNGWIPSLLSRIERERGTSYARGAPYLSLTAKEYFQRNCWASCEGEEPELEYTIKLIGAEHMCISTDYPHADSEFPHATDNLLKNVPRDVAAKILLGAAELYGFTEEDFRKADEAAAKHKIGTRKRVHA